jgi:hypothetical protein
MLKQLGKAVGKRFAVAPKSIGLPLHELAGITCPAFCMEIGLNKDNDWQEITDALAAALISALTL